MIEILKRFPVQVNEDSYAVYNNFTVLLKAIQFYQLYVFLTNLFFSQLISCPFS